jgi:DNA polymerase V
MAHYIEYSTRIYQIYLRYIAPEDIHVYSIDEVMMDVTKYLVLYKKTAHELAMEMIRAVLKETGITATAGIGPNLYLCKIAMDIEAKHTAPDADGVRIAELDEMSYRRKLWGHRPITDFWRVGKGTAKKLARYGMFTMGDVARYSLKDEDLLYKLFGVNAELLIDHAWGWEPCTIDYIKAYKPENRSFSAGQVLQCPYDFEKARIVVLEMADAAALDLVEKRLTADQMVLTVVYDKDNLTDPAIREKYKGPVKKDWYGRMAPKPAHGTVSLGRHTSSSRLITDAVLSLYDRIVDPDLLVRRIFLVTNHVIEEAETKKTTVIDGNPSAFPDGKNNREKNQEKESASGREGSRETSIAIKPDNGESGAAGSWQQLDLFTDYEVLEAEKEREKAALEKERRLQEAMLEIRRKYGKNAILKGTSLQEGATMRDRNQSIGGHKA